MKLRIALLPGDGIGPEVIKEATAVLDAVGKKFGHDLEMQSGLFGAAAIRATGDPLPEDTLTMAKSAGAVLMGAVGHPDFDTVAPEKRPEKGLLRVGANLALVVDFPVGAMRRDQKIRSDALLHPVDNRRQAVPLIRRGPPGTVVHAGHHEQARARTGRRQVAAESSCHDLLVIIQRGLG